MYKLYIKYSIHKAKYDRDMEGRHAAFSKNRGWSVSTFIQWQKSNAASISKGIMQKAEVISAVPTYPSYRTSQEIARGLLVLLPGLLKVLIQTTCSR